MEFNPVTAVKIPAPPKTLAEDEDEERGKALKRAELAAFLGAVDPDWRLFFEFLTVTGLRIGEAIGLVWKNVILTGDEPRIRVREQIYKGRRKKYLKSDEGNVTSRSPRRGSTDSPPTARTPTRAITRRSSRRRSARR